MNYLFSKSIFLKIFTFIICIFQQSTDEYLYLKNALNEDFKNIFLYGKPVKKYIGETILYSSVVNPNGNTIDDFYLKTLSNKDVGNVNIYKYTLNSNVYFIIYAYTDGDDGAIEVYDEKNRFIFSGNTNSDIIYWATRRIVRNNFLSKIK